MVQETGLFVASVAVLYPEHNHFCHGANGTPVLDFEHTWFLRNHATLQNGCGILPLKFILLSLVFLLFYTFGITLHTSPDLDDPKQTNTADNFIVEIP